MRTNHVFFMYANCTYIICLIPAIAYYICIIFVPIFLMLNNNIIKMYVCMIFFCMYENANHTYDASHLVPLLFIGCVDFQILKNGNATPQNKSCIEAKTFLYKITISSH